MIELKNVRNELHMRRALLVSSIDQAPSNTTLSGLLEQVDAALTRISAGSYGTCEICNQPIEDDRLRTDPLLQSCASHLPPFEQARVRDEKRLADVYLGSIASFSDVDTLPREEHSWGIPQPELLGTPLEASPETGTFRVPPSAHKRSLRIRVLDALKAAWSVFENRETENPNSIADKAKFSQQYRRARDLQSMLLPKLGFAVAEWETYYHYEPADAVGGDYCDLIATDGELYFLLGDAVGHGLAASIIASQLHSLFRALLPQEMPLNQLLERINRIFCECGITDYYATLVCGRASSDGQIELVNAGHLPPLMLRTGQATPLAATGLPLGLFYTSSYEVTQLRLVRGEMLLAYTDGITEARNSSDMEYGAERLMNLAVRSGDCCPEDLVRACLNDITTFAAGTSLVDDRTLMVLRHA
jgi:phosphoserine phosphatase RsbU/P